MERTKIEMLEAYARDTFFKVGVDDDSFINILLFAYDNELISFNHAKIDELAAAAEIALLEEKKSQSQAAITAADARIAEISGS